MTGNDFRESGDSPGTEPQVFESSSVMEQRCHEHLRQVFLEIHQWAHEPKSVLLVGPQLLRLVWLLGRLLYVLYLAAAEEAHSEALPSVLERSGKSYQKRPRQSRRIGTLFGKIRYWRTYMYSDEAGEGFYPLDNALGLTRDRFTLPVVSWVTRLATKMSYEGAAATFAMFMGWAPSTKTIEELTLGMGARAREYQEQAPPPPDDGEVLVIQIDSKGVPTATASELRKRRGKRRPNPHPESKRHRGRAQRKQWGSKKRRKKGDKSKNAKMATHLVMYTLKSSHYEDGKAKLLGPLNVRHFSSFAPKKYAFCTARREAIKRGFSPSSGKLIQFVNDGDEDLELYRQEYFGDYPQGRIIATADLPHVLEYLWSAGTALHEEGSGQLHQWVKKQKKRLLNDRGYLIRKELKSALAEIPKKGPGNKGKRKRLEGALRYLTANAERLNYKRVAELDLEMASGMVEGAVKNILGLRFDHGGMRWIPERAEALLQLRCIEANGQWDDFIQWVQRRIHNMGHLHPRPKIRQGKPAPLPAVTAPHPECVYVSELQKAS